MLRPGTFCSILRAHICHHVVVSARGWDFSRTKKSPVLASVRSPPSLQPGAARIRRNFGRLLQDVLDLTQQRVGVLKRRARRGDIVEHEAAFVHRRHEAGADLREGHAPTTEQRQRRPQQRARAAPESRPAIPVAREIHREPGPIPRASRLLAAEQTIGQQRHGEPGNRRTRRSAPTPWSADSAEKARRSRRQGNASGTKMTMVARDEPASGARNSTAATACAVGIGRLAAAARYARSSRSHRR